MKNTVDLFEHYEILPQPVQAILRKWDDYFEEEGFDLEALEKFNDELKPHGYTFDYGLDFQPAFLTKIIDQSEVEKVRSKTKLRLSKRLPSIRAAISFFVCGNIEYYGVQFWTKANVEAGIQTGTDGRTKSLFIEYL